jgi:hypothetical protein
MVKSLRQSHLLRIVFIFVPSHAGGDERPELIERLLFQIVAELTMINVLHAHEVGWIKYYGKMVKSNLVHTDMKTMHATKDKR